VKGAHGQGEVSILLSWKRRCINLIICIVKSPCQKETHPHCIINWKRRCRVYSLHYNTPFNKIILESSLNVIRKSAHIINFWPETPPWHNRLLPPLFHSHKHHSPANSANHVFLLALSRCQYLYLCTSKTCFTSTKKY